MNTVSFPKLGIGPLNFYPYFNLFGIRIYWYGVIIALGIALCFLFAYKNAKKFGILPEKMTDVVLVGIIGGIACARLYYVIFQWQLFSGDLLSIFNLRTGGLAIYGGIIGALGCGAIACKVKKVPLLPMLDLSAVCFLLGQGIGRWGNFINVEAYGCHTNLPWGMTGTGIPQSISPVHPTFLYESLWCLIGFTLLTLYIHRRKFDGELLLLYFIWYGFERALVEGLRMDSLWLIPGVIRISQLLSAVLFLLCLGIFIYKRVRIKKGIDKESLYVNSCKFEEIKKEKTK